MSEPRSALYFLGPQWFAPVMGWCGLTLAWHRAGSMLGEPAHRLAQGCGAIAALIFCAVLAGALLRLVRHPGALPEDLAHPVRQGFAAAFPVSFILLGAVAVALDLPAWAGRSLWGIGLALQLTVTTWLISRWMRGQLPWASLTPVLYIPIVGNILVPLAGVPLGHAELSWAFFGIGAFFWPVVTAMLLVRQAQQPLPDRLAPSWFITVAPPSVAGASGLALGAPAPLAFAALGVASLLLLASATRVPAMLRSGFGMPAWAASFPLAAFAALLLRTAADTPALQLPGVAMLAVCSLVIAGLTLATMKGLRAGTLLAPEPVATLTVQPNASPAR
jgi:tellurite resistance protein